MVRNLVLGIAASALLMSSPAAAESWWWVAGEPGGSDAVFVDADSIATADGSATFQLAHVTEGQASARHELSKVRCDATDHSAIEAFVCATPDERMEMGAMLGSLTPELAARAIFSVEG